MPFTANIPLSMVNVLVVAFLVAVVLGVALCFYAANELKKCEDAEVTVAPREDL